MKLKSCKLEPPEKDGIYFAVNHRAYVSVLEYKDKKWYVLMGTYDTVKKEEAPSLDCSYIDLEGNKWNGLV